MKFYNYKDIPSDGFYFMLSNEKFHNGYKLNNFSLRHVIGNNWHEVVITDGAPVIANMALPWTNEYRIEQVVLGPVDLADISSMAKYFDTIESNKIIRDIIE